MVKSKNGGNKDGLGAYEMAKMALVHPIYFTFLLLMLKAHLNGLVKRMLGIH